MLTTFITPFGKYCYNVLPFGISPASEHYQKVMKENLSDCEGTVVDIDDILVHGTDKKEHDERLRKVLRRLQDMNVTLNPEKCKFARNQVQFLGHIIDGDGIHADPEKVTAITDMAVPSNISELRRFLGMVNQLSKFSPELAEKSKPLRELLSTKNEWTWGESQTVAFNEIKQLLISAPVLALYDYKLSTTVASDASKYGLGAVLKQQQTDGDWRPVAFASRALSATEQRYAPIEKESLGVTWACEKFAEYVLGMTFHVETDHKPLVSLLGYKHLDELSPRIQRMRMRLMRFSYTISHVPGKDLVIPDTLSRTPIYRKVSCEEQALADDVKAYVDFVLKNLPTTENRLQEIREKLQQDEVCRQIMSHCENGWPEKQHVKGVIKPYYQFSGELSVQQGLLLKGTRLVIPTTMRLDILDKLHEGHLGITKCRERAKRSVWWPGLSKQLEDMILNCNVCIKERSNKVEPLIPSVLPDRPWQKIGTDLFELKGKPYLLCIDYFSRFAEVALLSKNTTSPDVITHLKSWFARHGIPDKVVSDNGPQFQASEFAKFADNYGFKHEPSSPKYPQSNGEVERAVKTVKSLLRKSTDPYLALMAYRSTPLENGYSPSELLFGRKIRTTVPVLPSNLLPCWPQMSQLRQKDNDIKEKQKHYFDQHHRVKQLPELSQGQTVWIQGLVMFLCIRLCISLIA